MRQFGSFFVPGAKREKGGGHDTAAASRCISSGKSHCFIWQKVLQKRNFARQFARVEEGLLAFDAKLPYHFYSISLATHTANDRRASLTKCERLWLRRLYLLRKDLR